MDGWLRNRIIMTNYTYISTSKVPSDHDGRVAHSPDKDLHI